MAKFENMVRLDGEKTEVRFTMANVRTSDGWDKGLDIRFYEKDDQGIWQATEQGISLVGDELLSSLKGMIEYIDGVFSGGGAKCN